jgi:type VI protein secretion system component Hcp
MYQNDNKGNTTNYYTIAFTGVVLVAGNLYKPDVLLQTNSPYVDMETFGFTYATATWTDNNASTSATFTAAGASS